MRTLRLGGSGTSIQGDDLSYLSFLSRVWELELNRTGITDNDMVHLKELTNLRKLSLREANIGAGVRHLTKLQRLTDLGLSSTLVDDQCINFLAELKRLKKLDLSNTLMTIAPGAG